MKIISGGQTGADRAGLNFAIDHGIEHGGHCPKGRRAEDGKVPEKYNLIETSSSNYLARTELNVINSDATVIFKRADIDSPGSIRTEQYCRVNGKPYLIIGEREGFISFDAGRLVEFLDKHKPKVLNIAGHRETSCPGIHNYVYMVFTSAKALCDLLK